MREVPLGSIVRPAGRDTAGSPVRHPEEQTRRRFVRGWAVLAAVHLAVLATGLALLWVLRGPERVWPWGLEVGAVLAFELLLPLARRRQVLGGENLDRLWGAANRLTLLRGILIALLAGFLFAPRPAGAASWVPALLFTAAAAVDFLDGWCARRTGSQTRLGALLDVEFDALGILLALALAVQYGRLPAPFLGVGLARYLFVAAAALRRRRALPVLELPPSYLRRRLAGFQMGVLAVVLWPLAAPPATTLAEGLVAIPLLAGFLRDWLLVSGRLDPRSRAYRRALAAFGRVAYGWVPLVLRGALAAAGVLSVTAWLTSGTAFAGAGGSGAALSAALLPALRLALVGVLVAGWRTSPAALLLLLLEALRVFRAGADPLGLAVIAGSLLLYVLGPGPFAAGSRSTRSAGGLRTAGTHPGREP
jgi:CDP-diacylglycerol--glycerol-3-phosphate 3-phosphatidyltransferase